ncbi:hypothetical protein [Mesorhizobium sp.]|uniref:hypothetical protein n=1 Tax=Mesorhizobium sp. TaxID=1871066 RepID=UPI0025E52F51|nr:hypothetical protein [Mesorhizobium sp.]
MRDRGRLWLAFEDHPDFGRLVELQVVYIGIGDPAAAHAGSKALAEQGRHALQRDAHETGDIVLERDVPGAGFGDAAVQIRLWLTLRGLRGLARRESDGSCQQNKNAFFHCQTPVNPAAELR